MHNQIKPDTSNAPSDASATRPLRSDLPWWNPPCPARTCRDSVAQTMLVSIVVVFTVGAVFGQILDFGTVWDDQVHLTHPLLTKVDPAALMQTWQQGYEGLYIPLSYTILGLVGALSASLGLERADPTMLHALSLLLHSINVLLVYRLLRRLQISLWPALAAALLFAIHPLQVESVVWISEIRGLLAFAFGAGALLLSLYDVESLSREARLARATLASLLFALAVLAKPSAVVMPLFLMLIGTLGLGWSFRSSVRRAAVLLLLAVVLGVVTATIQGFNPSIHTPDVPLGLRPLVWMDALASYLGNLCGRRTSASPPAAPPTRCWPMQRSGGLG